MTVELKENETVRLNKLNKVYSAFPSAFKALGFNNQIRNPQDVYSLKKFKGEFFRVFSIGTGKYSGFVGIEDENGIQILVENSGITAVRKGKQVNHD